MFQLLIALFHVINFLGPNGPSLTLSFTLTAFHFFLSDILFCVVAAVSRVLRNWTTFFTLRCFLLYTPSPHFVQAPPQPAFFKASLGAGISFLKVAGPLTVVRNIDSTRLFESHSVQQKVLLGRFYHVLKPVAEHLINLLLV